MSGRKVFVTGWRGPTPPWGADWTFLPVWWAHQSARPCSGGSLLVLGSEGIEALSPLSLAHDFYAPYAIVLGVVQAPCRADLDAWRRLDFLTLVLEKDAESAVREARALSCRMPVPPGSSLPAEAEKDPHVLRLVETLLTSPGLTVGGVARLLGLERHRPTQALKRGTGRTLRDVRLAYVLHYYLSERARGIPANRIRVGLDYSDTSHLLRAVKAARRRFGPR